MRTSYNRRRAEKNDSTQLLDLISSSPRLHRHLDWRPPVEWLGSHPFWLVEEERKIHAALAIPPDPGNIFWVRLFACSAVVNPIEMWDELFSSCLTDPELGPEAIIPSLALSDWYSLILRRSGFELHQSIIGLEREVHAEITARTPTPELFIRLMEPDDLVQVTSIDQQAFEPIWQNSAEQVKESFEQAAIATVAELGDEIVGYQITTINMFTAHLARLAVKPGCQNKHIGRNILLDLFKRCKDERLWQITVNTQDNNHASLALYQGTGFHLSGDEFPVYLYRKKN